MNELVAGLGVQSEGDLKNDGSDHKLPGSSNGKGIELTKSDVGLV